MLAIVSVIAGCGVLSLFIFVSKKLGISLKELCLVFVVIVIFVYVMICLATGVIDLDSVIKVLKVIAKVTY